ncbi:RNA methyltransferase [Roseobacter sp. N2S]|uniref:RNA methyltransferase n=1 Tax=Roseobacter sp. N2S TaxID=2663844 RepID=UPI0028589122|nr:RNA methyltransferase [Roseobacter sp. N2S]MDR6265515.1 tRNA/rRNA methyltransferase [Roseobacter sp. N2S]
MSGTDHAKAADWGGPQPVVVLVQPQMGENIGAAARAMWNFGLERMRLVNPRDGWPNQKAVTMSSGAARVIDAVQVMDTTEQAISDLHYVFATTARGRDLTKPVVTPERAMEQARAMVAKGQKVGILFGPERSGLENPDIARANAIISVPVNPAFASLNLAQCVLLLAYEWRRQQGDAAPEVLELAGTKRAESIEIQKLTETLEARLESVGFFWPDHKAESMVTNLRNMISRLPLTQADVRIFHGVIKSLADKHPKSR